MKTNSTIQSKWLLIFLFFLGVLSLKAQNIQANLVLFPPHAPFLSDFTTASPNKMQLTLHLTDHSQSYLYTKLRVTINGPGFTLYTKPTYSTNHIIWNNTPEIFAGIELQNYFNLNYLEATGIDIYTLYSNGGELPEGLYTICFEAEALNGSGITSNQACATAYLGLPAPPIITSPIGPQTAVTPQFLNFSWVPQHPGGALVEYDLDIWETVENMSDQDVVQLTAPLFQTTTSTTNFSYSTSEPPLVENQEYICRVRVSSLDGNTTFANDGYSEPEKFTWEGSSSNCGTPLNVQADSIGINSLELSWQHPAEGGPHQYLIQYQDLTAGVTSWEEIFVAGSLNTYEINSLIAGHQYAVRVKSICTSSESDWVNIDPVTLSEDISSCLPPQNVVAERVGLNTIELSWDHPVTGAPSVYLWRYRDLTEDGPWINNGIPANILSVTIDEGLLIGHEYAFEVQASCGSGNSVWVASENILLDGSNPITKVYECDLPVNVFPIDNQDLLQILNEGETFKAGDFDVIVTSVSGGGGTFFGKGYITVPYLNGARVNVRFSKIQINTDRHLIGDGIVYVTGSGLKLLSDDLLNGIGNILDALDTVEDILNALTEILETIDEIVALVEPYLPSGILQDLIDARDALALAQAQYESAINSPNPDPAAIAQAEQALQAAIANLELANDAYINALKEFFESTFNIVIEAIRQLKDDYDAQANQLQSEYNNADMIVDNQVYQINQSLIGDTTNIGNQEEIITSDFSFEVSDLDEGDLYTNPDNQALMTTAADYYEKELEYAVYVAIDRLKQEILDEGQVKDLGGLLLDVGTNLFEVIGVALNEDGLTEEQTVPLVKPVLVDGLKKLIQNIQ